VRQHEGEDERQRTEERRRRRLWLKAIARDDLPEFTETKLKYERVCFRHFVNSMVRMLLHGNG